MLWKLRLQQCIKCWSELITILSIILGAGSCWTHAGIPWHIVLQSYQASTRFKTSCHCASKAYASSPSIVVIGMIGFLPSRRTIYVEDDLFQFIGRPFRFAPIGNDAQKLGNQLKSSRRTSSSRIQQLIISLLSIYRKWYDILENSMSRSDWTSFCASSGYMYAWRQ